jgi:hypothetical protein
MEPETSLLCSKEPTNTFIKNCYNSSTVCFLKQWRFGTKKLFSKINCIDDNKSTYVNNDSQNQNTSYSNISYFPNTFL